MNNYTRVIAVVLTCALAQRAVAQETHLVSADALARAADDVERVRTRDLATVDAVLALPETAALAGRAGMKPGQLRSAARTLDPSSLRSLAGSIDSWHGDTPGPPALSLRTLIIPVAIAAFLGILYLSWQGTAFHH